MRLVRIKTTRWIACSEPRRYLFALINEHKISSIEEDEHGRTEIHMDNGSFYIIQKPMSEVVSYDEGALSADWTYTLIPEEEEPLSAEEENREREAEL